MKLLKKNKKQRYNTCHDKWKKFVKLFLGKSNGDFSLHHEQNNYNNNSLHDIWK